jgi:hypothetical protein
MVQYFFDNCHDQPSLRWLNDSYLLQFLWLYFVARLFYLKTTSLSSAASAPDKRSGVALCCCCLFLGARFAFAVGSAVSGAAADVCTGAADAGVGAGAAVFWAAWGAAGFATAWDVFCGFCAAAASSASSNSLSFSSSLIFSSYSQIYGDKSEHRTVKYRTFFFLTIFNLVKSSLSNSSSSLLM